MAKQPDLLLEYSLDGRQTWAYRFYQDGLVKEYSDSEMVFENGKVVTREVPLEWRKLTHLPAPELEKLVKTIRKVDFFSLPDKLGTVGRSSDAPVSTWSVHLDGKVKTVTAVGEDASSHPAIKALRELIQNVTAASFDSESQAGDAA